MASPREVEIPVTLSLSIPKQFGKTALAEQIQAFVIEAMDQAWKEGKQAVLEVARDFIDPDSMEYLDEQESPYRKK